MKDVRGNSIEVGSLVKVVALSPNLEGLPQESKELFELAIGKTFRVNDIDDQKFAWIDLDQYIEGMHSISIESSCLEVQ